VNSQPLSRNAALRRILSDGIDAVLLPAGFQPRGRRAWLRQTPELQHLIGLSSRYHTFHVQWGVLSPEVVPFLWGAQGKDGDVAWSAMTGWPSGIHHPAACPSFRLDEPVPGEEVQRITAALSEDLRRVEEFLGAFSTRRDLRAYLLANRDPTDSRGFIVPAALPLKLFTAAALAVIDRDPAACGLIGDTEQAMAPFKDNITRARLSRLRAGAAGLCG
jgi:hypothetical protein